MGATDLPRVAGGAATEFTWSDYFRRSIALRSDQPVLDPLGRPCHDCAVTCGLYTEISDALAAEPHEVVQSVSAKWFCHNNGGRACAGNIENVAKLRAASEAKIEQGEGSEC